MSRKLSLVTVFFLAAVLFATPVFAAEEDSDGKSPAEMQREMEMLMGPAMGQMMQGMMDAMFMVLAKPETAERLASFTKNYYDALVKKGFTKDEALRIVSSVGMPSMGK
jgi:hypothetical protein